jgi:hypothetical protein
VTCALDPGLSAVHVESVVRRTRRKRPKSIIKAPSLSSLKIKAPPAYSIPCPPPPPPLAPKISAGGGGL